MWKILHDLTTAPTELELPGSYAECSFSATSIEEINPVGEGKMSNTNEAASYRQLETARVLLIEDNSDDARMVERLLSEAQGAMEVRSGLFEVSWVRGLAEAFRLLSETHFSVVLVDLQLSDATELEALAAVRSAAGSSPVIVLTDYDDDGLALTAIQRGAQDYVAKDHLDGRLLARTIRHAIERKRAEVELRRIEQRAVSAVVNEKFVAAARINAND